MKFIHILKDGKMDEINYNKKNDKKILIKYLSKISKSHGSDNIKKLYTWDYQGYKLICYGWYDGDNGFENSHALPRSGISDFIEEDSSLKILYGDLFIFKFEDKYTDLTISEYSMFYSNMIGDYSDYDTEDEASDENSIDVDIEDKITEDHGIIKDNLNELEYDNNDYC